MRVMAWLAAVVMAASMARGDALLVTKDGKAIRTAGVRMTGSEIRYTDRETGEEKAVATSTLDGVVAIVQRGRPYEPDDVQKQIDKIKKLKSKHVGLLRQLNEILQAWEALLRPTEAYEEQIAGLAAAYEKSGKFPSDYKKTVFELGMIKFKDVGGVYAKRIDESTAQIRSDFVAVNRERLKAAAANERLDAQGFVDMKRLSEAVVEAAEPADREGLQSMVASTRQRVFASSVRQAEAGFASGKSLDAYLKSSALLQLLKRDVATTDAERSQMDGRVSSLRAAAARALPSLDFRYNGFPMGADDQQLYARVKNHSSRVTFTSTEIDEQAFLMPLQTPPVVQMGRPYRLALRAIFNAAQPTGRVFGVTMLIPTVQAFETRTVRLPALAIREGRAEIAYSEAFDGMDRALELGRDRTGETSVYLYLSALKPESDPGNDQWDAISAACRLPARP